MICCYIEWLVMTLICMLVAPIVVSTYKQTEWKINDLVLVWKKWIKTVPFFTCLLGSNFPMKTGPSSRLPLLSHYPYMEKNQTFKELSLKFSRSSQNYLDHDIYLVHLHLGNIHMWYTLGIYIFKDLIFVSVTTDSRSNHCCECIDCTCKCFCHNVSCHKVFNVCAL